MILGDGRGARARSTPRSAPATAGAGETALIRLEGEVVKHPESVVLPLLLPDSPVAIWWPADAPDDPAGDPLGALAQRRITDAAATSPAARRKAIHTQCPSYAPGNTDLAWTRLTAVAGAARRRARPAPAEGHRRVGDRPSGSAPAPTCWSPGWATGSRSTVERNDSEARHHRGRLETKEGPIAISRPTASWRRSPRPASPTGRSR